MREARLRVVQDNKELLNDLDMGKYIDADHLKVEIEKHIKEVKDKAKRFTPNMGFFDAKLSGIYDVIAIIDSLQQEQPDCHTVEDWIQHIKNADQLTKDIFSKGPYDVLYDALNHPYQHCYDAIKEFGELCFQTGVNSVKQEQPEVDLEEEIETYFKGWYMDETDQGYILHTPDDHAGLMSVKQIARHFYELGLNAKKEDEK